MATIAVLNTKRNLKAARAQCSYLLYVSECHITGLIIPFVNVKTNNTVTDSHEYLYMILFEMFSLFQQRL